MLTCTRFIFGNCVVQFVFFQQYYKSLDLNLEMYIISIYEYDGRKLNWFSTKPQILNNLI